MDENSVFPIDLKILEKALKTGIKVKKEEKFETVKGVTVLMWHPMIHKWGIAYGDDMSNAGFAILEDYGKEWEIA